MLSKILIKIQWFKFDKCILKCINNKVRSPAGCPHHDSVWMAIATFWWSMLAADENIISQETRLVRLSMLRLASLQLVTLYLASDPWSHPVRIRSTHYQTNLWHTNWIFFSLKHIYQEYLISQRMIYTWVCQGNGLKPFFKPIFIYHLWGHVASTFHECKISSTSKCVIMTCTIKLQLHIPEDIELRHHNDSL